MILSPTQIETFDPETTWGCNRKWYFTYIRKIRPTEKDPTLELGDAVHKTIEDFFRTGDRGRLHDLVLGAPGGVQMLEKIRPRVRMIERKIEVSDGLTLAGVPYVGRIDWAAEPEDPVAHDIEVGDHKTTSTIAKYAKTAGQIKHSVQMNLYGNFFLRHGAEVLLYTQDYWQTKKAKACEKISIQISKPEIESRILEIETVVEKMKLVAEESDLEKIAPNEKVCNIGYGCPHRAYCPRSGVFNMASLLDAFKESTPAPVAAPEPTPATAPAQAAVIPPDAPKPRKFEIKAEVPLPETAPTPPQAPPAPAPGFDAPKRGRPVGSRNKPKDPTADEPANDNAELPKDPTAVKIERITIRHGAKVGLPNFSSATVEVEYTGLVTGSVEAARDLISLACKDTMKRELEVYVPKPKETEQK